MAPIVDNHSCGLLSPEENLQVFKLLGNRCQSLCTTVVQLYLTRPPNHSQWFKKCSGVLCFVKDNIKKNFFFRLFCVQRNMKIWEHEMYNNMDYVEGTPFFHMFEGEDCLVAFNFADVEEARDLKIVVLQKIHARKKREDKRSKQHITQSHTLPSPTTHVDISNYKKTLDPAAKHAKRKRNITKADIGRPIDFKHISHVGWNSSSGFDINTEDEQLKAFFKKAGVSEQQLQDRSTREFVYDFINRNGGREAIEQTNNSVDNHIIPPAVPPRGPPLQRSAHFRNAPPPPVPSNKQINNNNTPRKTRMEVPPPKKPAPLPNSSSPSIQDTPLPTPPTSSIPPPPPPPLPMLGDADSPKIGNIPSPPLTGSTASPSPPTIGNAMLLESIRNGTTLRSVEERNLPPQDDARGDLLSEIRKGCKLKPVDERDLKPISSAPVSKGEDLASALARALAKRSEAIHSEDDDDKSDSTGSDWD